MGRLLAERELSKGMDGQEKHSFQPQDESSKGCESTLPASGFPSRELLEESLTPASKRILSAAVAILDEEGPRGLTIDRVAKAARVNRWTVRNNFGSKSALISAAADFFLHDKCVNLTKELSHVDPRERPARIADGIREMVLRTDPRGYFLTLPLALENETVRRRWLSLYRWWYRENARWIGVDNENATDDTASSRWGMAHVLSAIIDGLWLQAALHDEEEHLDCVFVALEELLAHGMFEIGDDRACR